jgi:hypothetical protein
MGSRQNRGPKDQDEGARNFHRESGRSPNDPASRAWDEASPLCPVRTSRRKQASSSAGEREDGESYSLAEGRKGKPEAPFKDSAS